MELEQLRNAENLNDARSRYLTSKARVFQHTLHVVSIGLMISVGVLFVVTPPGAAAGLIFGLSMGATGCKVVRFVSQCTMFKGFIKDIKNETLNPLYQLERLRDNELKLLHQAAKDTLTQRDLSSEGA